MIIIYFMKDFTPELLKRKIVIISDYVNPAQYSKKDLIDENAFIDTVKKQIQKYGVQTIYAEVKDTIDLEKTLEEFTKDEILIFNWCEFLEEKEGTSHLVTRFLENLGYIFTGASTQCLLLTNGKERTKQKLIEQSIPTPKYTVISADTDLNTIALGYPIMLKLEDRHSSAGITAENVVYNSSQLDVVSKKLLNYYHTNVLAEEFINGPEYTVTVWGNGPTTSILNCSLVSFVNPKLGIIDTEVSKFVTDSEEHTNTLTSSVIDGNIIKEISETILRTYAALNFSDYGRFELREKNGTYYVIDCNPNPWLGLDSVLFKGAKKLGYNYGETLLQICEFAVKRNMQ